MNIKTNDIVAVKMNYSDGNTAVVAGRVSNTTGTMFFIEHRWFDHCDLAIGPDAVLAVEKEEKFLLSCAAMSNAGDALMSALIEPEYV